MALTGNETLQVLPVQANGQPAATTVQTTTQAIAQLAALTTTNIVDTAITTAGAGTLTAAGLVGGQITRTGPVAAYSDATDTAAAIVAALPEFVAGQTFLVRIKNATPYTQTLTAGTGITLPPTVIIPAFSVGNYFVTVNSATTATFTHMSTVPIADNVTSTATALTTLSTVGAGTITAAGIVGGITARTGAQSGTAFTDTTDTAAAIIAAQPGLVNKIGSSFIYNYSNQTNALATITGGTGVTVSGITAVPQGMIGTFLITYTAAATLTMVGLEISNNVSTGFAFAGSTSGQAQIVPSAIAGNTVATLPAVTGTLQSTTGTNLCLTDVYRTTAPVTANATVTPATVTGLSGAIAVGTYRFRAVLPSTVASGTGGIAYNFLLTTAVLSAIQYGATMKTASALQYTQGTTAASGTVVATQAAVVLETILEGTMVVSTAGTFAIQMAQAVSNASNTVALLGGSLELTRIA